MRPLVLLAMVSAGFLPATSQTPGFAIAGQVVRHADDHPVRGARVSIAPVEQRDRRVFCRSGENGQFSFSGVSAGKYSLAVTDHEWSQAYKQFDYFSTAIAVGPGLDSEHIVFRLESPASIVGSVLDDAGDPVRGAMVYLFGRFLSRGAYQTGMKGTVNTNADGSFHFTRVAPGTYYVAVSGRPWYAQNPPTTRPEIVRQPGVPETVGLGGPQNQPASQPDLDVAYPVTYYQNATSPEAATPLKLEEGHRADIKFNLQPVPALHIALDGVPKDPDQQIFGQLSQVGPGGSLIQVQAMPMNSEIVGVAPGNYVLSANLYGQKQPVTTGSQTVT